MALMVISRSDNEKYNSTKRDIVGSIQTEFDKLFTKSHLVDMHTDNALNKTYITFQYVEDNMVRKETISIPSSLFTVPEKK